MNIAKYLNYLKGQIHPNQGLSIEAYMIELVLRLLATGTSPEFSHLQDLATADGDTEAAEFFDSLLTNGDTVSSITGVSIFTVTGTPDNGTGANGDLAIDTDGGDVYKKTSGAWALQGNIKGPAGSDGAAGANGAAGPGVATGGSAMQFLRKKTGTNYDTEWANLLVRVNSLGTPLYLDPNGVITPTNDPRQVHFVMANPGDATGITLGNGTMDNQELWLIGADDGQHMVLAPAANIWMWYDWKSTYANWIKFIWSEENQTWVEMGRSEDNFAYALGNSGTTLTVDFQRGKTQNITLTGNCTFTFANPKIGDIYVLKLTQDGTGSRTVTWPGAVKWNGGSAPTLSTAASSIDIITLYYDGTNYFANSGLGYA